MILAAAENSVTIAQWVAGGVLVGSFLAVLARAWRFFGRAERHLAIVDALDRHLLDVDITPTAWLKSIDVAGQTVMSHTAAIASHETRLDGVEDRLARIDRQVVTNTEKLDDVETWISEVEEDRPE